MLLASCAVGGVYALALVEQYAHIFFFYLPSLLFDGDPVACSGGEALLQT